MQKAIAAIITTTVILGTIIAVLLISLSSAENPPQTQNKQNIHAWTKAICDKNNLCQDYLIECKDENPTRISPITGAIVKFDSSWQDPRNIEQKEKLCD